MKTKKQKRSKVIFRYYEKRISGFISCLHNARLTGYISDVHQLRVEMKKIMTLFDLFIRIDNNELDPGKNLRKFRKLFSTSGDLRETQLTLKFLLKYKPGDLGMIAFRHNMEHVEKRTLRDFQKVAIGFNEEELLDLSCFVKKMISRMDVKKFIRISRKFIRQKMEKIHDLQTNLKDVRNAHKIRKHIKSIATVVTVLYLLQRDENSIKYLADLNSTEKMLGSWHDRVVFLDALDRFIEQTGLSSGEQGQSIQQIRISMNSECEEMFSRISGSWAF